MHSVGAVHCAQAWACLLVGTPSDCCFPDFQHACARRGGLGARGAACWNSIPPLPPPPPDPPKFSNPFFSNLRFWGESVGAEGAEFFFFALLRGGFFFTPCVCIQDTQRFVESSNLGEKTQKILTHDLTSRLDLG